MLAILSVLIGIGCAYRCGLMATDRNRRVWLWRGLGFACGVVALLVVHLLEPVESRRAA